MATKKFVGISGIQRILGFLKEIVDSFSETIEAMGRRVWDVEVQTDARRPVDLPAEAQNLVSGDIAAPGEVKPGDLLHVVVTTGIIGHSSGHYEATVTEVAPPDREEGFMFAAVAGERLMRFWRSGSGLWGMSTYFVALTDFPLLTGWESSLPEEQSMQPGMEALLSMPPGTRFPFLEPERGEEIVLTLKGWQVLDAHFPDGYPARGRQWDSVMAAICMDDSGNVYILFDDCGELRVHSQIRPFGVTENVPDGMFL